MAAEKGVKGEFKELQAVAKLNYGQDPCIRQHLLPIVLEVRQSAQEMKMEPQG